LFASGAVFPIVPFFWAQGRWAIASSALASALVLGGVGMLTSLFNGRSALYSAVRQLIFGCVAAAVTYGAGAALGTTLS
jgi:VIT1/CCC1 family predicted Fe2+/Mn2+ transporter